VGSQMKHPINNLKPLFETLYERLNRRSLVHPDPLEFLYRYPQVRDREVVALLASCLAYGNVKQILRSISWVLERLQHPGEFIRSASLKAVRTRLRGFRHRFSTDEELSALLWAAGRVVEKYGSLGECLLRHWRPSQDILSALEGFVQEFYAHGEPSSLLPRPWRGGACKRLHLMLRWMVRKDAVDPGGWKGISPSALLVPLDTHMHRLALAMGFTRRRSANRRTVLEVTQAFRLINPQDPVKYDFALTRLGISPEQAAQCLKGQDRRLCSLLGLDMA